jgi:hypothetical protein
VAAQPHDIGVAGEAAIGARTFTAADWYWEYEAALELLDSVDFSPGVSSASKLMAGRTTHASVIANAVAAWGRLSRRELTLNWRVKHESMLSLPA